MSNDTMKTDRQLLRDTIDHEIGMQLIEVLQLKVKANGRVDTTWGDKTPMGLARTVKRIQEETR